MTDYSLTSNRTYLKPKCLNSEDLSYCLLLFKMKPVLALVRDKRLECYLMISLVLCQCNET